MNYKEHSKDALIEKIVSLEKELEDSKKLKVYKDFFETCTEGFAHAKVITDKDGKPVDWEYLDINPAFTKLTQLTREACIGKRITEILPGVEKDAADWIGRYGRVALTGVEDYMEEYSGPLKKWYSVNLTCPRHGEFAATFNDITKRKNTEAELLKHKDELEEIVLEKTEALRKSNLFLKKLSLTSMAGVYIYDLKEKKNSYINKRYTEITGFTLEDINSMKDEEFIELFHPEDVNAVLSHMQEVKSSTDDGFIEIEYRFKKKDGGWVWCLSYDTPFERDEDGSIKSFMGSFIDINSRKFAEGEKERLYSQITKYNNDLKRLLYISSHDLRTPLVNIDGFSNDLVNEVNTLIKIILDSDNLHDLKQSVSEFQLNVLPEQIKFISKAVNDMDIFIKGLLKLSRLGGKELVREEVDVYSMLVGIMKVQLEEAKPFIFDYSIDRVPKYKGDEFLLRTIFRNLISNSWKYFKKDTRGKVEITAEEDQSKITFKVKDNGVGIAECEKDKVFDFFYRSGDLKGVTKGEGIGLSLVKWATLKHGGEVSFESKEGEGSTFIISLPK